MKNKSIFASKLSELKEQKVYRILPIMNSPIGAKVNLDGKEVINLCSNNYLGFANHKVLKNAAKDAIDKYGVGPGSVRTIIGNISLHEELDKLLAIFKREEAAISFQSGFNCNAGAIQAIVESGDLIISDELNHASIIDGARLSRADKKIYRHADMDHLEEQLKQNRDKYKQILVITDGVFSMDGDIAPLPEIVELTKKYDAMIYVDDAHGSGVLGENGRGTVDHFHLHGQIDFCIGTLSKAIGVIGGYVASSKEVVDWLNHRARTILFSTSMTPPSVAACIAAIKLLMTNKEYTEKLWRNAKYFQKGVKSLGFDIGKTQTPITPLMIGDEAKANRFSKTLLEKGLFASPIVFPTVPKGLARIRCMISAEHEMENLDKAISILDKAGKEQGVI